MAKSRRQIVFIFPFQSGNGSFHQIPHINFIYEGFGLVGHLSKQRRSIDLHNSSLPSDLC